MEEQKQPENIDNKDSAGNPDKQQNLSKHEKRMLKEQKKEAERTELGKEKKSRLAKKSITKYSIIGIVLILVIVGSYYLIFKPVKEFDPFYKGFYHWHANLGISVCGQPAQLRCATGMCGPMSMHHHNDDIIHLEGNSIAKEKDIALGVFFNGQNLDFSSTSLLGKKNGDLCEDGQPGMVKMYVNGAENSEFENYILKSCDSGNIRQDCEKIELKFE